MQPSRPIVPALAAVAACLACAQAAFAHPGHPTAAEGLAAGALHPLLGLDHLLAALASGLLAVRIGTRRACWLVPAAFAGSMLLGGALAATGLALPPAEWGIALSVLVLGLLVAAPKARLGGSAGVVAVFAACHGHAHVAELSGQALAPYMAGILTVTLLLHAAAIAAGVAAMQSRREPAVRLAGAAIATGFAVLLATNFAAG